MNEIHFAKSFMMMKSSVTINQTMASKPQPNVMVKALSPSKMNSAPVPAVIKRNAAASAADKNCAISVSMGHPC